MTREQILKLEPGRELDCLVAKTLGWTDLSQEHIRGMNCPSYNEWFGCYGEERYREVVPYFSESYEAMFLVEVMTACQYVKVNVESSHFHGDSCRVTAADPSQRVEGDLVRRDALVTSGHGMPHAVCLAFLIACTEQLEETPALPM